MNLVSQDYNVYDWEKCFLLLHNHNKTYYVVLVLTEQVLGI